MKDIRTQIKDYLGRINVNNITIIDWCSGNRPVSNSIVHNDTCRIITVDKRRQRGPTVTADVCVPIFMEQADMAFCLESLEHLTDPDIALDNVYNNLKEGGYFYVSVPFICPIHSVYGDYWRWTLNGIRILLKKHNFNILEEVKLKYINGKEYRIGYLLKTMK
jgi:SAM-dependent methyltransferase